MPCIFCIAVFLSLAGAVTAATIDQLERELEGKTATPVRRVVDTAAVAKLEFSMEAAGKVVPVAVTVLKDQRRVRIQLLSHELDRPDADALQEHLAEVLGLDIVERSTPESEALIHDAMDHDHSHVDLPAQATQTAARPRRGRRA